MPPVKNAIKKIKVLLFVLILTITPFFKGTTFFEKTALAKQETSPSYSSPVSILIPKIELEAKIEPVGLDEKNNMIIPAEKNKVGWYKYGKKPGENGNAVIAGHNVWTYGQAVFYRLNEIQKDDLIFVKYEDGSTNIFKVERVILDKIENFEVNEIFVGNTDKKRLILITCAGDYKKEIRTFDKRLVVYSTLLE